MTRYTNIGYKRKYLEAGFDANDHTSSVSTTNEEKFTTPTTNSHEIPDKDDQAVSSPKKHRRTSSGSSKNVESDDVVTENFFEGENGQASPSIAVEEAAHGTEKGVKKKAKEKNDKLKKGKIKKNLTINDATMRQLSSERRRLKRIRERHADTICFACREKGHAAKDCPAGDTALEGDDTNSTRNALGKDAVGMCYRCGSTTHPLSRCRRRENPANPLPYATCFVCSARGHLASSCSKNGGRGVYPNGGACKICGDTSHLAKNCSLRKEESSHGNAVLGIGSGATPGGDEDDFHIFRRRKADVEKEEKDEIRTKRMANVRMGVSTGIVKSFPVFSDRTSVPKVDNTIPPARTTKKVVYF